MISGNTSLVTWIDVDAADTTERRFYSVRYRLSGRRGQYYTVNTTAQQVYVTGLQPNQQYEFSVKVIKGRRQSTWSMSVLNTTEEAGI